ncbi:hypothetical protein [Corynebacterium belfantii]|uniref:Uncharacterized protein n=1 Tax=Corynebacterium belfantii TaxID=2014537 RepID=A0ABS0LFJ5_9CORY|nr:hypothetical protein [Corynebacterium belfantii]MBG9318931.1 hypothetical protein [Corynebacterium belfantii]MBG9347766.1 hypothetical protein [Corynebacterium belfantii]MBG9350352.1 hypothetical protein [Corynebacterium belfantii]MBG9354944.1 hypothetical protein [Corynebacterium belfantii]SNW32056.1 hypothetical protein FRC0043_01693 [Corynebacterium belfantii]
MITLHTPTLQPGDTFTTSGRMVLDPRLTSAQVSEEINGVCCRKPSPWTS